MKIESQKLSVTEAFRNFYYVVPDYQREYVWEDKNVSQLLSDIYDEFEKDPKSEYFIGSIVVHKEDDGTYEVIDGQQRITTLFITLCALKRFFKDKADHLKVIENLLTSPGSNEEGQIIEHFHLDLQYEDTSHLLKDIFEEKPIPEKLLGSSEKINDAFETIFDYIKTNLFEEKELIRYYGYFMHKVNFVQIETPSVSDALKIFETINERGVGLNPMNLLKNLIFRQLDRKRFKEINSEWKKITALLDKNQQKPLRFLRYFLVANFDIGKIEDGDVLREDELYTWIVANKEQCGYANDPFGFVHKILKNAEAYISFFNGNLIDDTPNIPLINIRHLGGGAFSLHLLLLLSAQELENRLFCHFIKQIETLIFYYFITRTSSKDLEQKFSKWTGVLRKISLADNQEDAYNSFIETYFVQEISALETTYRLMFTNLTLNSMQRYRFKYLLARISQYVDLQRIGNDGAERLEGYLKKEYHIEHILPNTPTQEHTDAFAVGQEQYDGYKIRLGNLTLLEQPINIVIGRNFFQQKCPFYEQSKFYLTKSISTMDDVGNNNSITKINRKLKSFSRWDKKAIEDRQEMLFNLAKDIWKVEKIDKVIS